MRERTSLGRGLWRSVPTGRFASLPAPSFGCDARGGGPWYWVRVRAPSPSLARARVVWRSSFRVRVCGCLGSLRHGRGWLRSPLHSRPASRHVPPFGRANPPSRRAHRSQRSRLISWVIYSRLWRHWGRGGKLAWARLPACAALPLAATSSAAWQNLRKPTAGKWLAGGVVDIWLLFGRKRPSGRARIFRHGRGTGSAFEVGPKLPRPLPEVAATLTLPYIYIVRIFGAFIWIVSKLTISLRCRTLCLT